VQCIKYLTNDETKGIDNDHSKIELYRAEKRNGGIVYTHKKYDEIHYYLGIKGLTGRSLFSL